MIAKPGASSPAAAALGAGLRTRLQGAEPLDPLVAQTEQIAENMEPVIPHTSQAAEAKKKLAEIEKKFGKKPNILIFLMDNAGYGDIGINGGGLLAGAPTPNIDRLGREGLHLLSAYAQPSCTPTRVTLLTGRLPMRTGALRPSFAGEPGVYRDLALSPDQTRLAVGSLAGGGTDNCRNDPLTGHVSQGADQIREVNLYPQGCGVPGNRGTVDIGSNNNSTADIARQIVEGVSEADAREALRLALAACGGAT